MAKMSEAVYAFVQNASRPDGTIMAATAIAAGATSAAGPFRGQA